MKLEIMIAKASSLLMRDGLNLNQKKVKIMSIKEFKRYYSFQNFSDLARKVNDKKKAEILRAQIAFYFRNRNKIRKSGFSLLKRILGVLAKTKRRPSNFLQLKQHLFSQEIVIDNYSLTSSDLSRIYVLLNKREKGRFLKILEMNARKCLYTAYLYNLRVFYKSIRKATKTTNSQITAVAKFYNFKKIAT
jgi:hypothetical protein